MDIIMIYSNTQTDTQSTVTHRNDFKPKKGSRLIGGIHVSYLLWVFIPLLVFACLYSYHQSVKLKQEKPFPSATITATACHYPQDIEFRFFMLSAGSFIGVIYFSIFGWLNLIKRQTSFPFKIEKWVHPLAQVSIVGFYFAVATIDGHGTTSIHGPGAVFFFIVLFICLGYVTFIMGQLKKWQSGAVSRISYIVKNSMFWWLVGVIIYCLVGLIKEGDDMNHDDPYVVIIEWNLALVGMTWLLTFVLDWKDVYLTLIGPIEGTVKMIEVDE